MKREMGGDVEGPGECGKMKGDKETKREGRGELGEEEGM